MWEMVLKKRAKEKEIEKKRKKFKTCHNGKDVLYMIYPLSWANMCRLGLPIYMCAVPM